MRHHHYLRILSLVLALVAVATATPPSVVYETTLPGYHLPQAHDLVVDAEGNVFGIAAAYADGVHLDVLVYRLDPAGEPVWTRYIEGEDHDYAAGIALDQDGQVWIAGWTDSADFPVIDAMDPTLDGFRDIFLTRLSADDGTLLYSTLIGGDYTDAAGDIAIDQDGTIVLAGSTGSTDFPTVDAYQDEPSAPLYIYTDCFVMRLSPAGDEILYSTYLGGFEDDAAVGVALDPAGDIVLYGHTDAGDFPLAGAIQDDPDDLFVAKLSADGSTLLFGTYLGGEDREFPGGMALDQDGEVYLTGATRSVGFPTTAGAYQEEFVGEILGCEVPFGADYNCEDIYVARLSTTGGGLGYATYIGGTTVEFGRAIAVGADGSAYVAGYTYSDDFPPDGIDFGAAFVLCKLSPSGGALDYTFAVDSGSANRGNGVAVGADGDVYLSGTLGVPASIYVARLQGNPVTAAGGRTPTTASALSLRPAMPNPFNPVTSIEYVLPEGAEVSQVSLRIFDVRGRLVRDLVSGRQAAGRHVATWFGRDDRGLAVSSGVYFHRLSWNGQQRVGRMVLVR